MRVKDPCAERRNPFDFHQIVKNGFSPKGYRLKTNTLERTVEMMFLGELPNIAPWLAGAGANISLPKKIWELMGGFDEKFGLSWGCEDLEFALRPHDHGVSISFSEDAIGVHLTHEISKRWEEHKVSFARFAKFYPKRPEVEALPYILGPEGDPVGYVDKVMSTQVLSA